MVQNATFATDCSAEETEVQKSTTEGNKIYVSVLAKWEMGIQPVRQVWG